MSLKRNYGNRLLAMNVQKIVSHAMSTFTVFMSVMLLYFLRYGPHLDSDPFKPRVPALITHFVAYKNQDHGAWLRGGDVWLDDCQ